MGTPVAKHCGEPATPDVESSHFPPPALLTIMHTRNGQRCVIRQSDSVHTQPRGPTPPPAYVKLLTSSGAPVDPKHSSLARLKTAQSAERSDMSYPNTGFATPWRVLLPARASKPVEKATVCCFYSGHGVVRRSDRRCCTVHRYQALLANLSPLSRITARTTGHRVRAVALPYTHLVVVSFAVPFSLTARPGSPGAYGASLLSYPH